MDVSRKIQKLQKLFQFLKVKKKKHVNNYRPISILPILSKIIEKVANNRLSNFLHQNSLLYNNQYGFRKNSNTENSVLDIVSDIQLKLDKKFKCLILSLDLCKAFDTVNHKILLEKMYEIGVRGFANAWFKNYLDNRQQFVRFSKSESSMKKITCGVPQGSVLAPTLFLIYINSVNRLNLQGMLNYLLTIQ